MDVSLHKKFYKGEGDEFESYCKAQYGKAIAMRILRRLRDAKAMKNLSGLMQQGFPGRWHWLSGTRYGQISADLDRMERLIFEPVVPMSEILKDRILDNDLVTALVVVEVADTHDE